jgi:hypothetical protein
VGRGYFVFGNAVIYCLEPSGLDFCSRVCLVVYRSFAAHDPNQVGGLQDENLKQSFLTFDGVVRVGLWGAVTVEYL